MAEEKSLHEAFIDELRDSYDGERQLLKALPKLARAATAPALKQAFTAHLEETREHVARLEQAFELLDERVRGKHCDGIAGIVEEGKSIMEEDFDEATMDACLIAAGQRTEHYEIAAYGTLVAWAEAMGHDDVATLLKETLEEEKAADEKLTALAEGGINTEAASGADPEDSEESDEDDDDKGLGMGKTIAKMMGATTTAKSAGARSSTRSAKASKSRSR